MKNQTDATTIEVGLFPRTRRSSLRWAEIKPAKVNDEIYAPINVESDEFIRLVESIRENGLLEPIHVTRDHVIISGHRRHKAISHTSGVVFLEVPVVIHEDIASGSQEHIRLLVEANSQRVKTPDMMVREAATMADPKEAHARLKAAREKAQAERDAGSTVEDVEWYSRKRARSEISDAKRPMLEAAKKIIDANREYWPLSVRAVHYRLLNDPPLKHAKKPSSRYVNDLASYKELCKILAAARVEGLVRWDALSDETRPIEAGILWDSKAPFVGKALSQLFTSYERNLLQTQDDYVVMLAEKLTVRAIFAPVCRRFCVPLYIGRGYSDIGSRHEIATAFRRSGKRRLVLLFVNDLDPEGWNIPQTVCQSMNEDFGIDWRVMVSKRVAVTSEQAEEKDLPPNPAKETSTRFDTFVDETGSSDSWELEALEPSELAALAEDAIVESIDVDAFNLEVEAEAREAAELEAMAEAVKAFFQKRD